MVANNYTGKKSRFCKSGLLHFIWRFYMNNEKLITIIIPTYNSALFFDETLRHLVEQTNSKFKVLVIDDNSTDKTAAIAKSFSKKLSIEIIIKSNKVKKGAAASINLALQKVNTKYFGLIDSDAYLHRNWVEEMLRLLPKRKIVGAPIFALKDAGIIAYVCGLEIEARYDRLKKGQLHHLSTCNLAGRAELIKLINLDESLDYAYDHQLSFQLKKENVFFFLTKKTFCHHVNKGGLLNFFKQQFKIAKYHAFLSKKMKKEALQGDEISPNYLILQPIFLFFSVIFLFFNLWVSAIFFIVILFLNVYFIIYVIKKYFFYFPMTLFLIVIKNLAWICGACVGIMKKNI